MQNSAAITASMSSRRAMTYTESAWNTTSGAAQREAASSAEGPGMSSPGRLRRRGGGGAWGGGGGVRGAAPPAGGLWRAVAARPPRVVLPSPYYSAFSRE